MLSPVSAEGISGPQDDEPGVDLSQTDHINEFAGTFSGIFLS
jgi:hypothetical protein